jgi:DNA-binding CsgD family transcriptional regulator
MRVPESRALRRSWQDCDMQTPQSSSRMIGRENELRALNDTYALAAASMPQAVVIGGEAGLGKTRLLREFLAGVPGQPRIVTGQCVDLGSLAPPYAPITAVLRSLAAQVGLDAVIDFAGPGRDALSLLLPEVGPAEGGRPNGNRVLESVATILERASAGQPTVVVIEDLHWADDATLAVLRFILRAFGGGAFLLALTYRSDDVGRGHPLRAFLSEVERGRSAKNIRLERLSMEQVRSQIEAITGRTADYKLVENIFVRSDGIPFFVEELLGLGGCEATGDLPSTLRDLLLARYERLDESVQYFLRVVAAGGVRVPHTQALQAYDRPAAEFDVAARAAHGANLLRLEGSHYAFGHALLREAIHADLLPGERTRFHTRYAEAIEEGATTRRDSAEIAYHWHAANVPEKSFGASIAAMGDAECSYAYSTAARMGERALDLWDRIPQAEVMAGMPRFALMGRTASAHNLAGDGERSLAVIRLAVADGGATGPALARLLADQSRYLAFNAQTGSVALLLRALELTPAGTDEDLRASLLNRLAARYMLEADLGRAIEVATESLVLSRTIGNAAERSVASNLRGVSRIMAGELVGGRADVEAAEDLAEGDPDALLRFRINYSDILHLMGLYDESIQVAEDGIESARALGVERTTGALLSSNAVEPLFARGDWARAGALLSRNLSLSPPSAFHSYLLRSRIFALLWGGDVQGAEALLSLWNPLLRKLAAVEVQSHLPLLTLAAEQAWVLGDLEGAWREVAFVFGQDFRPLAGYDLPLLAVAARILGARRSAGLAVDDDAEPRLRGLLSNDSFWPTFPGWSALFEAELGGTRGDGADPAPWHLAAKVAGTLPAHLRFYISLRTGLAEHAAGNRQGAIGALRAARDGADALGAGLVVSLCDEFAARTGLPLSGRALRPNNGELTGRESQVLALVAEGLSNRQIGEQLFISGKTVSVHVSAIMRKLGVSTRTEAAVLAPKRG